MVLKGEKIQYRQSHQYDDWILCCDGGHGET